MKQEAEAGAAARVADLKNALEQVKRNGELPTDLEEKESFFMTQVALGESLCASEGKLNIPSRHLAIPPFGFDTLVTPRIGNEQSANFILRLSSRSSNCLLESIEGLPSASGKYASSPISP